MYAQGTGCLVHDEQTIGNETATSGKKAELTLHIRTSGNCFAPGFCGTLPKRQCPGQQPSRAALFGPTTDAVGRVE